MELKAKGPGSRGQSIIAVGQQRKLLTEWLLRHHSRHGIGDTDLLRDCGQLNSNQALLRIYLDDFSSNVGTEKGFVLFDTTLIRPHFVRSV
jgi:hypothetical protein